MKGDVHNIREKGKVNIIMMIIASDGVGKKKYQQQQTTDNNGEQEIDLELCLQILHIRKYADMRNI